MLPKEVRALLPVSIDWMDKLDRLGATDSFQGKLRHYSKDSPHPFWVRTLTDVLPITVFDRVAKVTPEVKRFKIGGKHNSAVLRRHMYCTQAWSTYPCQCIYKYEGWNPSSINAIGRPNSDPPLRASTSEAPRNNYHNLVQLGVSVQVCAVIVSGMLFKI